MVEWHKLCATTENLHLDKQQAVISISLNDLPDELQLKIYNHLTIKDLICCGQVSKRTRRICLDALEWKKINLNQKIVPAEFIKYVLDHGCQYLNLSSAKITGNLNLDKKV